MANNPSLGDVWDNNLVTEPCQKSSVGPYTAVIHFHGMGSQRRLQETCLIVDKLDEFIRDRSRTSTNRVSKLGEKLFDVTCHVEPCRVDPTAKVHYVRACQFRPELQDPDAPQPGPRSPHRVHFYEGYWAPITAEGIKPWTVFGWILKQTTRPFYVLGHAWRSNARLRRSALRELWQAEITRRHRQQFKSWPFVNHRVARTSLADIEALLKAYKRFEGLEARRDHPVGTFKEFRAFLDERLRQNQTINPRKHEKLLKLADAWLRVAIWGELRNLFVLFSLLLLIVLIGLALVAAVYAGVGWAANAFPAPHILKTLLAPTKELVLYVLGLILTFMGLPLFLTNFMGDVVYWCTYEETDVRYKKRREILDFGVSVVKHVLKDKNCKRVVILSHSLGTAVAHDVLLEIGKDEWARTHNLKGFDLISTEELNKIEHFVTAASPIDKIHYFFESDPGPSHRFTRVSETLRGDMGRKPFGNNNNRPFLHWINFWDKADVISGSLESPANETDTRVLVDNVQVYNGTLNPGKAHTTYFKNPTVVEKLYEIIFLNKYSYRAVDDVSPPGPAPRPYEQENIGPGQGKWFIRVVQAVALLIPWSSLAFLLWLAGKWLTTG